MGEFIISGSACLLAIIGACLALYYRAKAIAANAASLSLQKQAAELEARAKQHDGSVRETRQALTDKVARLTKLEKDLEAAKNKHELANKQFTQDAESYELRLRKLGDQAEHFQSQTAALTLQIQEIDSDKRSLRLGLEQQIKDLLADQATSRQQQEARLREARGHTKKLEDSNRKLEAQLSAIKSKVEMIDPLAIKKARVRVHQYNHLYQIMRGHKEMAEERNKNWELALRIFASWIISEKLPERPMPLKLGNLVGAALEAINQGPLVNDGEEDRGRGIDLSLMSEASSVDDISAQPVTLQ